MLVKAPDTTARRTRTTCPYCGVGCGIIADHPPGGPVSIEGDPEHPANHGRLCSKGAALAETLGLEGRLLHPEIGGQRVGWDRALDLIAERFAAAIECHGPDSVAFYVSGQLLTEDYYVANKLMKGFIGSANIDTNSRLCMASSVSGHRRAFGSDTVPGCYEDLEQADLVVLAGSNLAWCHPVLYQRLQQAKSSRPDLKIVLIDPRRTPTAALADLHLAIAPDGDVALFCGLLRALVEREAMDIAYIDSFTNGFIDVHQHVAEHTIARVARETDLDERDIATFYDWFAATEKTVTLYSQGVNQSSSGTDKVNAIINCHLATGRIGKPGAGPFSITGQPNAMGGREVGGLASMLAAHMDLDNPAQRELVRRFWNAPAVANKPGLKAVELFDAVGDGRIKAIWIMATNPVDSLPRADAVAAAIADCPFVVVSDVVAENDTIRHADVKLPSMAWGEKDGTVTNSERRISRQRAFLRPPGETRADWWQVAQVAQRMGFKEAFDYADAAAIFREHAALSSYNNDGSRAFDIGAVRNISRAGYDTLQPFQWPRPASGDRPGSRFFSAGGFHTADGRARLVVPGQVVPPAVTTQYPFVMNTGRVRDHWHTMTRTARSERLSSHIAEPFVEIHPADAAGLQIGDADLVEVATPHGEFVGRAVITDRQKRGCLFVPIHWTDQFASKARVDALVPALLDPVSGQPASKSAPASARRFESEHFGFAVSSRCPDLSGCDYWAVAKCYGGWRTELAFRRIVEAPELLARRLFRVGAGAGIDCSAYADSQKGDHRLALFEGDRFIGALYLCHRPVRISRAWVAERLGDGPGRSSRRVGMIAGRPGVEQPGRGAIICACHGIGATEIADCVRSGGHSVRAVGEILKAGTECGSCRPEISEIIDEHRSLPAE